MSEMHRLLTEALQGDEEAIGQVAARLEVNTDERARQVMEERMAFRRAVDIFKVEFREVASNPAYFARAQQIEQQYARQYPGLSMEARMRMVGKAVLREQGIGLEKEQAGEAVAAMKAARTDPTRSPAVELEDEDTAHDRDYAMWQAEDAEQEAHRRDVIEGMRRFRATQRGDLTADMERPPHGAVIY